MRKGETYKSKLDGTKWTITKVDRKKGIVHSVSGKKRKQTSINYFNKQYTEL